MQANEKSRAVRPSVCAAGVPCPSSPPLRRGAVCALASPVAGRFVASITALGFAASTLAASFVPAFAPSAFAQTITDPTAPIEFQPRVTSSANGTPAIDIVAPGQGGVSHNKFREYNIDTRGLILNNSMQSGTSVLGGAVAANPNLSDGRTAKIILNEVTGTNRSVLNGLTEVFGSKADVIVANPNGVGCIGCGFINTGSVTLSSGVPLVDADAGTVSYETRSGDISVSGSGVSAPAGQLLDDVTLIGRTISLDGTVKASGKVSVIAGATRYDGQTAQVSALAGVAPSASANAIQSTSAGVISAASMAVLSSDINTGVVLAGHLQSQGSSGSTGDLSVISAGVLQIVSGQAAGNIDLQAGTRFDLSRDLAANGQISITAHDASLLNTAGLTAGQELQIVTANEIVSHAVLKAGGNVSAAAGGNAGFSGLIAGGDGLSLSAAGTLSTDDATLHAPAIRLDGGAVDLAATWLIAPQSTTIIGTDITLGEGVLFQSLTIAASASNTLTLGTVINDEDYPGFSLAFHNLVLTPTGVLDRAALELNTAGSITNSGLLRGRDSIDIAAADLTNTAAGIITSGPALDLDIGGSLINQGLIRSTGSANMAAVDLTNTVTGIIYSELGFNSNLSHDLSNLGKLVSSGTLKIIADDLATNTGLIQANGDLILDTGAFRNEGATAVVNAGANLSLTSAGNVDNITGKILAGGAAEISAAGTLSNLGEIVSAATLKLVTGGFVANTAVIQAAGDLTINAGGVRNDGVAALIETGANLTLTSTGNVDNLLGRILARGSADIVADGTLTNMSAVIESGAGMRIDAGSLLNTALAGTDGGTVDANETGDLAIEYNVTRDSHLGGPGYFTTHTAIRDEYSGSIDLDLPGIIRSGGDLLIEAASLVNDQGRILAEGDLSIIAASLLNDARSFTINHYRNTWSSTAGEGGGHVHFSAPVNGGWAFFNYTSGLITNPAINALANGGDTTLVIAKADSPVAKTYAGKAEHAGTVEERAKLTVLTHTEAASVLNLAALGLDPDDLPDVVVIGTRAASLGSNPYIFQGKTLVGQSTASVGSLIKAKGSLLISAGTTTNLGTMAGDLVSIEGGSLANGPGSLPGVDFVLDDVSVPTLNFGPMEALPSYSLDPQDFGTLLAYTGSLEAATLLGSAHIAGSQLTFFADPVAEAAAFGEAFRKASGLTMTIDGLSDDEARELLYKNALAFAEESGARYGVSLSEAHRATLTEPLVWHETRIIDGRSVLVPVLYLPPSDDLLRGGRGAGLVSADDLLIDIDGRLANNGTLVASGLASISAAEILNQRSANTGSAFRDDGASSGAFGRADSGLISAGTLLMTADGDLINRGGTISSAGSMDLSVGGNLVNETMKVDRMVDFLDGCVGKACGTSRTDWNVAQIVSGAGLTIIAGNDLVNKGGSIGAVTDAVLAAGGDVRFQTLQDTFLREDYKQRGFLSGITVVSHAITTQEASAQSLLGNMTILAGYSLCDGGGLCKIDTAGGQGADAILDGALVSAYGDLAVRATGDIDMGAVSSEVVNTYKQWGFQGLGWGKIKQGWNEIDTRGTRLSGDNVTLSAGGSISGVGTKISAATDLLMLADGDIRFAAAQDAHWFTEKGFYIGLSFPGSGAVEAALSGGSAGDILNGLADLTPLTRSLARLANADNGLAAGLAAFDVATQGASVFGKAANGTLGPQKGGVLAKALDPLGEFRDAKGNITAGSVLSSIGINISSWKKEERWSESMASELVAGGDVVMRAGVDAVFDQGTKLIAGGDVTIEAERDILMAALVDYAKDKSSSFGLSLSLSSVGFNMGKSQGYDEVLTNAQITAGGDVSLTSGRDTIIASGNVSGAAVAIEAGRDLAVLSPQAKGWRNGSSFGLTIGFDPLSLSISGSKEDGTKAWSSGSSIIARDGLDINVTEDTVLQGALLQATDGDIRIDTGTLTVSDNHDTDQYTNAGGSIGLKAGKLDTVGFSYEKKDKQGETRTTLDAAGTLDVTIHDADKDGVSDTAADEAAAEQLLAAINKDASTWQEITKDSHIKLSGELNVTNLMEFGENLKAIQDYTRAQNAAVPDSVTAQGPEAVDLYRDAIVRGLSGAELENYVASEAFAEQLNKRNSLNEEAKAGALNREQLAQALYLVTAKEQLYFDENSQQLKVVTDCGTFGYGSSPCGVPLNQLSGLSIDRVDAFIETSLATLLNESGPTADAALKLALDCAIAWTIQGGSFDAFDTIGNYLSQNAGQMSEEDRTRAGLYLTVARANAGQISSAVDSGLIKNLNDESINWGSQLYDLAKLAGADPDAAWGAISELQYSLKAMGDSSELGANTWARMQPALAALADELDMGDAINSGTARFNQMSEDQRLRTQRGIQAWLAGDGSFENLPEPDRKAASDAIGMGLAGVASGPGAALGAIIGGALWTPTKNQTIAQNAYRHFKDHGAEFGAQNAVVYTQKALSFLNNPPPGTLTKVRTNGDVVRYDPLTNVFGVMDKTGAPRTFYKPAPASATNPRGYDPSKYSSPLEYFNAQ